MNSTHFIKLSNRFAICTGRVVQVKTNMQNDQAKSMVIGGTGLVGGYILEHLVRGGERPLALSRSQPDKPDVDWLRGDLEDPDTLKLPEFTTLYCTADAVLVAGALPLLFNSSFEKIVVFSSTSVITKQETEIAEERDAIEKLADAERKIVTACEKQSVDWTILRPTLIYGEGRDTNITPLSRLIKRFGFMPLVGGAPGLRQPVHAEDLAIGAISAALSPAAVNRIYSLPGGETLTYREMIGRVFDGLRLPRRTIPIPVFLWRASFVLIKPLFPSANVAMGIRMMKDMAFEFSARNSRFRLENRRKFNPKFD